MTNPQQLKKLRQAAGHTQEEAGKYLYCTGRAIRRAEAGLISDRTMQARIEHYRLKLVRDGVITGTKGEL